MMIFFEDEDWDSLGIGIGHRYDKTEEPDDATMGIGIGHRDDKEDKEKL